MVASLEYSENKQAKFVPALCVLHNFISIHDWDFMDTSTIEPASGIGPSCQAGPVKLPQPVWVSEEEELSASVKYDRIANRMWADYQQYLTDRKIRQ